MRLDPDTPIHLLPTTAAPRRVTVQALTDPQASGGKVQVAASIDGQPPTSGWVDCTWDGTWSPRTQVAYAKVTVGAAGQLVPPAEVDDVMQVWGRWVGPGQETDPVLLQHVHIAAG